MIPLTYLKRQVQQRLQKLEVGGGLEVLTYKRNRGFMIAKEGEDLYILREHGYHTEVLPPLTFQALDKPIQKIVRREFPRSTNVRIEVYPPSAWQERQKEVGISIQPKE